VLPQLRLAPWFARLAVLLGRAPLPAAAPAALLPLLLLLLLLLVLPLVWLCVGPPVAMPSRLMPCCCSSSRLSRTSTSSCDSKQHTWTVNNLCNEVCIELMQTPAVQ
jgi:hypothetical protein